MLKKLRDFGVSENYFEIKRIGDFDNSENEGFDHIDTVAIDFDITAQKFSHEHGQDSFKSCDALDIIHSNDKINLIEFKQIETTEDVVDWIDGLKLPRKIKDSRDVLLGIIRKNRFRYAKKVDLFNSYEKNVIISIELRGTYQTKMLFFFEYLKLKAIIEKQFNENYIQGENFNDPVCIQMSIFDTEYQKYK